MAANREGRRHIISLNLARRQLNSLQCALLVAEHYGIAAKRKAAEARIEGNSTGGKSRTNSSSTSDHQKWNEIAAASANRDGWHVTPAAVREASEILDAPETKAAVERGNLSARPWPR